MNEESAVKSGGKVWRKNGNVRVYFSNRDQIAKLFNLAVVPSISGVIPDGFDGMITSGKTKSYLDCVSGIFYADSGQIATPARESGLKVKRLRPHNQIERAGK